MKWIFQRCVNILQSKLPRTLTTMLMLACAIGCTVPVVVKKENLSLQAIASYAGQPNFNYFSQMAIVDRSSHDPKLQILLPLYIYPNWYAKDKYVWKQVTIAAKKVPIVAIINPNSGPNHAPPNLDYQQGIEDLHQAGIKIVGYVPTNYANRDLQAVKIDIDLYTKYFKIDGIFIDEAANTPDKLNYYHQLYQYIKSRSPQYQAIVNPGTDIDESYLQQPVADVMVIFENQQKAWANYRLPTYTKKYSSQHFAALIHTTANRKLMKSTLDRVVKYKFGYVYITNDSTNTADRNPWDSLPEYWQSQVNYIQQLNTDR
jgi:hypothetical protein